MIFTSGSVGGVNVPKDLSFLIPNRLLCIPPHLPPTLVEHFLGVEHPLREDLLGFFPSVGLYCQTHQTGWQADAVSWKYNLDLILFRCSADLIADKREALTPFIILVFASRVE